MRHNALLAGQSPNALSPTAKEQHGLPYDKYLNTGKPCNTGSSLIDNHRRRRCEYHSEQDAMRVRMTWQQRFTSKVHLSVCQTANIKQYQVKRPACVLAATPTHVTSGFWFREHKPPGRADSYPFRNFNSLSVKHDSKASSSVTDGVADDFLKLHGRLDAQSSSC